MRLGCILRAFLGAFWRVCVSGAYDDHICSNLKSKSTHKTAKITAQFFARTLSRDECIEFDHRVPSVFCHCKAGKGRGATITAAVILCVRIVSFTLIFLKTHTYIHRHISEEKIVNPYRTDDSMPQKL